MTTEDLAMLYKGLKKFRGSMGELCKRTGYKRTQVRDILQGKQVNKDVLLEAVRLKNELEAKDKEMDKLIKDELNSN